MRYFKPCKGYENCGIHLPERSTCSSAGYDFFTAEKVTIPSSLPSLMDLIRGKFSLKPTIVYTHVKAKMRSNEFLAVYNRSSNPIRGLILANGVGVVDSDYYGNKDNDGDIGFAFYNLSPCSLTLPAGYKIGQGIFQTFLKVDSDMTTTKREGGFGSTGE